MSFIAFAIFLFLTAVALLHVLWGAGFRWPCKTDLELVSTVVGHKSDAMPTPNQCYLAALAIYVPGTIALMLAGLIDASVTASTLPLAGAACVLVFLGRGIAGYVPAWRERFPREPFATYDRLYYSPLCLLLAAGFTLLLINRSGV
ncbi:MAG: DUF3995 domain-containing protein [Afipia sp.]|nr:DUF3995 domain-containing protein [Afipia sp.]